VRIKLQPILYLFLILFLQSCYLQKNNVIVTLAEKNKNFSSPTDSPSTDSSNSSCPTNYVKIAANSTLGTSEFCLAKYEMKVSNPDGTPLFNGYNGGVALNPNLYKAQSRPSGIPWVKINYASAISKCAELGTGYHLATAKEWQAAALEIESVASNWSSNIVGNGYLYTGHSNSTISSTAIADGYAATGSLLLSAGDGTNPYVGTGSDATMIFGSGKEQRRTFQLANGEGIWDMAGNARDIIDADGLGGTVAYSGMASSTFYEVLDNTFTDFFSTVTSSNGITLSANLFQPSINNLTNSNNAIGLSYISSGVRSGQIISRGANFSSSNSPGLFASDFDSTSSSQSGSGGFRCASSVITTTNCQFSPTINMSASVVIGQTNMTSNSANQGAASPSANTLAGPDGVSVANNKLFIGDFTNKRYLIFNSIPTSNNASADLVLGQTNFTSISTSVNSSTTSAGREAVWTGSQLIVEDGWNARLLVYNSFPTANGQAADYVIGQSSFSTNTSGTSTNMIDSAYGGLTVNNNFLWLADVNNNRVLRFDLPITKNLVDANLVLGQSDFVSNTNTVSASNMNTPTKIAFYNGKMIVADRWNHRVLIFNNTPTLNFASADVVIGQTNLTNSSANQGLSSPKAYTLNHPHSVTVDNSGRLYIADTYNNRVLIFNSIPTSNNASADFVIGQSDFNTGSANAGGTPSASSLNRNTDIHFEQCSLIIGDQGNNRVLIFK
jgi:hypothetical protein